MDSRAELLVINQHYPPDTLASGQILAELAEDLVHVHGWNVTVVAGPPLKLAEGESWTFRAEEDQNGVRVLRVPAYNPERRSAGRRLLHYGTYGLGAILRALASRKPDVVLVMSTPPILTASMGLLVARLRKARFVYNIQDLFPDILSGRLQPRHGGPALLQLLSGIARGFERQADALVVIGTAMEQILADHGLPAERVYRIPNWADAQAITPVGKNSAFARTHGLQGKFVVMYSGNLGRNQDLDTVLAAAGQTRDLGDVIWLLIGDGDNRQALVESAREQGLRNVKFLPYQPRSKLSESLGAADVGLVTVSPGISPYLVPSKLWGIMAAGGSVLAAVDAGCEVDRFVRQHEIGLVVDPADPAGMAQAVRQLHANREATRHLGQRARQVLLQQHDRPICTAQYNDVLRSVL